MKFEPKTEKEIAEANLLPPGVYDFEVTEAVEKTSKAGNEMIVLTLHVYAQDGSAKTIKDYLLESVPHKLRHVADACGLIDDYEQGTLDAEDFVGKTGMAKIKIKKDSEGTYPDQNSITDYIIVRGEAKAATPRGSSKQQQAAELDDEIPF